MMHGSKCDACLYWKKADLLQYYSESRKVHDAQMDDKPDAASSVGKQADQTVSKVMNQDSQAPAAPTPVH